MKVLITNYHPINIGGAQASTYLIAKSLEKTGKFDVRIASTGDYGDIKTYDLKKFKLLPFSLQNQYLQKFLSKIIKEEKIDLIHPQERLTTVGGILAAKKNNIPSVVHFRDYWFACPESSCLMPSYEECKICSYRKILECSKNRIPWNIYKWSVIKSYWKLLNEADAKIAISDAVKRKLEICGIYEAKVIPNPINLRTFQEIHEEKVKKIEENYNLNHPIILYVGILMYHKGIINILHAISRDEMLRNVNFLIVGDGKLKEKCKNYISHHALKNVKLVGRVPFSDIPAFYSVSDIVVFPSIWQEPFGRVAIEAMAAGKPVVASNVGGIPDIIEHGKTGYLVNPFDLETWKNSIIKLIENENLRESIGKEGKKVARKYDANSVVKEITKIYEDALNKTS